MRTERFSERTDRALPPAGLAWVVLAILCSLYVISFVDRMILALLVEPITLDLGISDSAVGFLIGIGFALVYVLIGLPIAHWVDAGARRIVLVGGVMLWSAATIASGFAETFGQLAAGRLGVAIGEAALTPVAIAVIADMFPKDRRSLPTSIYMAVGILMGSGAFFLGGLAIDLAEDLTSLFSLEVWRLTLIVVGIPGFLLALVAGLLIGPARHKGDEDGDGATALQVLSYFRDEGRYFVLMFIGVGCLAALAMGLLAWAPTLLVRNYGFGLSEAGLVLGSVGVPAGVVGTVFGPLIVRRLARGMGTGSTPVVIGFAAVLSGSFLVTGLLSANRPVFLSCLGLSYMFLSAAMVMPAIVIQEASPPAMRARLMATHLLSIGLLGQGVGPFIVAYLSDRIGGTNALPSALIATTITSVSIGVVLMVLMHGRLRASPVGTTTT